ncbi:dihydroorotate dehydrogenase electron transfer subunit [Candidatus Micrarchaeota archaeon]|nr:dihydroorotate dehydrogenase electron transfer subunit [Candidatus Micrarchaeota archaeon]
MDKKFTVKIPKAFTISRIEVENYRVKTFYFTESLPSQPGQFAMVWLPGVDEKPMSINSAFPFSISFAAVGTFSKALSNLNVGDKVGVSGPFGTFFPYKGKKVLLVGGGYGVVPLRFFAEEARRKGIVCEAIIGAKNKKDIIFDKRFEKEGCKVHIATDDGSIGFKGTAVALAEKLLKEEKFDEIFSCGPEMMMFHLSKLGKKLKIPTYVSAERYMKCAIGICGACTLGGQMCCRDGTVMVSDIPLATEDFGKFQRDKSGKKVKY